MNSAELAPAVQALAATPTSNAAFLSAIFGPLPPDQRPMVCAFAGDPADSDGPRSQKWAGWQWVPELGADDPSLNWYFTLATYRPDGDGRYRRQGRLCADLRGVMLDDIGTKASRQRLTLPPSVLIETSAGNYQALYLFAEPVTDKLAAGALQSALIEAGLCDPGAHGPTARWSRLPFAINGKRSPPFACRVAEWHPERRYSIAQIRTGLALPDAAPKPDRPSSGEDPRAEWEARTEAQRRELVDDLRDALGMVPADDRGTWVDVGHYLKASLPDEAAYDIWAKWSEKSAKCDDDGLEKFWTLDPERCSYRSVFALAETHGWTNPRGREARTSAAAAALVFGAGPVALPPGASPAPVPRREPSLPPPPFVEVPIHDLAHAVPDPQVWWCDPYLPAGHVTLLGGHGGAGKSTLALMLAASIATGREFLGLPTRQGRVLYFSAEDPGSLVRRRLARICREFGADPAALAATLRILDATEPSPVLFTEQRAQGIRTTVMTATYAALSQYVRANAIDVVVVDNASDVFDADEINRAAVRAFIRSLSMLVRARNGAVLLLAHVDKLTSRAGKTASSESYSGSTAWHNSVRSRLFFMETGPGVYELQHQKSNLGPRREPLTVSWPPDRLPTLIHNLIAPRMPGADLRALLTLVGEFYARGEWLTTAANGRPNAAKALKHESGYPENLRDDEALALFRDAHRRGLLCREHYLGPDRKGRERWALTPEGTALITGTPG